MLAVVAACATTSEPGGAPAGLPYDGPTDDGEIAAAHRAALAAWQAFPVDRKPRPLVVVSDGPDTGGLGADDAKAAALAGNFELAAALPAAPQTVTVELPDGSVTVPAITAQAALDELRRSATASTGTAAPPVPPVRIVSVELGPAPYHTDRGVQSMPAWLFRLADGVGTVGWPAADGYAVWQWRSVRESERSELLPDRHAKISPDGSVLTVLTPRRRAPGSRCTGTSPR